MQTATDSFDESALNRELDRTKSQVFVQNGTAAFLGPLMCSMEFRWLENIQTAETDGSYVGWSPKFFKELIPATRVTVLLHELWHVALLHMLRRGDRDPKIWNQACDYRINNDLEKAKHSFVGVEWCCKDQSIDANGRMAEEDIYDLIQQGKITPPPQPFGGDEGDMRDPTDAEMRKMVNAVLRAVHEQEMATGAGTVPQIIKETLAKFLEPVVPWEAELMQFCTDLLEENYTWRRPNRRYTEMYLPSPEMDEGRLDHLAYYLDVSGSCSNEDVLRFNSEVKYIKEVLQPRKLTVCQFTTEICHETVFLEEDPFEETVRYGTGGTSFRDVRRHMMEHKPTAAIVFSDMDCEPMKPLDFDLPVIWCAVRARGHKPPFGKIIHIRN